MIPGGEVFYARSMQCSALGAPDSYSVLLDRAGGGVATPAARGCAVNPRRITHCALNETVLAALRAQKQGRNFPQLQ